VKIRRNLAACAGAAAVLGPVSYLLFFRRWCLTWGTSGDEVAAKLPGDELLPGAGLVTTRAITIDAPPEAIWPWLAQMGSGRGGAYTYDWIENLLGLKMHSAREILPEHQDIKVGDELPLGSGGPVMRVEVLDPPRALAIRTTDQNWVWIFALLQDRESTRLISRNRIATNVLAPASRLFYLLFMEPGSLVMERKMLLGIKHRAEDAARQATRLPRMSSAPADEPEPGDDLGPDGDDVVHLAGRPGLQQLFVPGDRGGVADQPGHPGRDHAPPGVPLRVDVVGLIADDRAALVPGTLHDRGPQVRPDDDRLAIH
jgi:hypothetical protein